MSPPRRHLSRVALPVRRVQAALLRRLIEPELPYPTHRLIGREELGLAGDDAHRYEPSGYLDLHRALYRERVTTGDVLVDIGAGRGRVLYVAARFFRFGRVVGLDDSADLLADARRNFEAAERHGRLRCPVELVRGDAATWPLPDTATHVWHANAVGGAAHRGLLAQIAASYDRRPRHLLLHYAVPAEHAAVMATGRFRPIRTSLGLRRDVPSRRITTYAVCAASIRA